MQMYASVNYTMIGSVNILSPVQRQPIIWNSDILFSVKP